MVWHVIWYISEDTIDSPCKLFADDFVVYWKINNTSHFAALTQQDMHGVSNWEQKIGNEYRRFTLPNVK